MLVLVQDNATVTVTRLQRASPPLSGTFSVGIFGQIVKGQIMLIAFFFKELSLLVYCLSLLVHFQYIFYKATLNLK